MSAITLNTMHKYIASKLTVRRYLFTSGEGEHASLCCSQSRTTL